MSRIAVLPVIGALLLSAGLCAHAADVPLNQPAQPQSMAFELGAGKGQYRPWGRAEDYRVFFDEFLPALFERTITFTSLDPNCKLTWIFTGDHGGFTIEIAPNEIALYQRFYDSPAFERTINGKRLRHPEKRTPPEHVQLDDLLKSVTVTLDHKLTLTVSVNLQPVIRQQCLLDVSRHQLRLLSE